MLIQHNQVLQRRHPVTVTGPSADRGIVELRIGEACYAGKADGGAWHVVLPSLEAGGPYDVEVRLAGKRLHVARNVYVGDLWVLAGQSNMEGCGLLQELEQPREGAHSFGMDDLWRLAEEPLHVLWDSLDAVHYEPYGNRDPEAVAELRQNRTTGAGLGLSFAREMLDRTGVPVGLLPCAQGGSSLPQWDPVRRGEGGNSLYGAMFRRVKEAGGRVAGLLWYQGESDAMGRETHLYEARFRELVDSARQDFGDPSLPMLTVQLGRFILPSDWDVAGAEEWNSLQEVQRRIGENWMGVQTAAAIDLDLDDGIHIGTRGLQRLGRRLARAHIAGITPRVKEVRFRVDRKTIRVEFEHIAFEPDDRVTGFSIQDECGREVSYIYKAEVMPHDPSAVYLRLFNDLPEGWAVWYGRGLDPVCRLVDADDNAAPVFGPILPRI